MTSAVRTGYGVPTARAEASARSGPAPRKPRQPVFIHDAIMPWRGETLLLAILRADGETGEE